MAYLKRKRSSGASARFKKKPRTFRPKYGRRRKASFRARRRLPVAFRRRMGRRSATINAARVLSLVGENKYRGYSSRTITPAECMTPQPKHGGTQPLSYVYFNAGENLSTALQGNYWNTMNAYYYGQGDTKQDRDGDFLFVKGTTVNVNLQMLGGTNTGVGASAVNQGLNTPVLFRLMVIKGRRVNNPLGKTSSVLNELFLDTVNNRYGTDSTTHTPYEYMHAPINKRNWYVIKDTKFILEPPAVDYNDQSTASSIQSAPGKHPSHKNFKFYLKCNRKLHYMPSGQPDNFDTQTLFILQAVNTGFNLATSTTPADIGTPRNFAVNVMSTTAALDS